MEASVYFMMQKSLVGIISSPQCEARVDMNTKSRFPRPRSSARPAHHVPCVMTDLLIPPCRDVWVISTVLAVESRRSARILSKARHPFYP